MRDPLDDGFGPKPITWWEMVGFGIAVVLWFVVAFFI